MGKKAPRRCRRDGRVSVLPILAERKVGPSRFPRGWQQVANCPRLDSGSGERLAFAIPIGRLARVLAFDDTGSLGGGDGSLSPDILTIQAEPPAVDSFDISFFAATVAASNFRVPHLCPLLTLERRITSCDQRRSRRIKRNSLESTRWCLLTAARIPARA
jgi:hypothetical protein